MLEVIKEEKIKGYFIAIFKFLPSQFFDGSLTIENAQKARLLFEEKQKALGDIFGFRVYQDKKDSGGQYNNLLFAGSNYKNPIDAYNGALEKIA